MKRLLRNWSLSLLSAASLLWLAGCASDESAGNGDPPVPVATPKSSPKQSEQKGTASNSKVLKVGPFDRSFDGIRFSVPKDWREVELSSKQQGFIDARFEIPTPDGNVMLTCSSNSGGIEGNVQRWIGQFHRSPGEKPTVEQMTVDGKQATWVDIQGEFAPGPMSMAASSPVPIERMLGVAIPLGSRDFYLKLTGTKKAVSDVRNAFREFARGAKITGGS